jgi:23S rRNA (cytidine1920-2'-O)/16S rRNA (cytidine1409-2'-O)-methyltransferase
MRVRADLLLVARGLFESRAKAQAAIRAGLVRADGRVVQGVSDLLEGNCALEAAPAFAWVSRAGVKLAHALDVFAVNAAGRVCLDLGASTGGFTQVLLHAGAAHVTAVDVGKDQMHASLREDARVRVLESRDARTLMAADFARGAPDLIVCDASFIGLEKILPPALSLAAPHAELIALIKPQFESGPRKHARIESAQALQIAEALGARLDGLQGFARRGFAESPIEGGDGAIEFLYWAQR